MISSMHFGMTFWLDDDNEFCYCPTFNNNGYNLWGGGDTIDRERVRDIILEQPQFTFGG